MNESIKTIDECVNNFLKPLTGTKDKNDINIDDMKRASRFNHGKNRWGLVDFSALEPLVAVLEFGESKYDTCNWKKGAPVVEICESLLRHTFAFLGGEDKDTESGLPHFGHMMFNVMMLSYTMRKMPHFDDRNKYNIVLSEKETDNE